MKIQILSDLHFEFHKDSGRAFVRSLDPAGVDVLVVAGVAPSFYVWKRDFFGSPKDVREGKLIDEAMMPDLGLSRVPRQESEE